MSARRFSRAVISIDVLLARCNRLLSVIYISLITSLIAAAAYLYFTHIHALIVATAPPRLARLHTFVSLYLLLSVAANYFRCLVTSAGAPPKSADLEASPTATALQPPHHGGSAKALSLADDGDDDEPAAIVTRSETWRYCAVCRAAKPPRTHHCTVCNVCVLRLCHHCPALGRCVGRDNYPFFFRFVSAAAVGSAYAAGSAIWLRSKSSALSADGRLFAFMVAGAATSVSSGVLAVWHWYLVATAQTTVEWLENFAIRRAKVAPPEWGRWGGPFTKGAIANLREAFGGGGWRWAPWWMTLLLPVKRVPAYQDEAW